MGIVYGMVNTVTVVELELTDVFIAVSIQVEAFIGVFIVFLYAVRGNDRAILFTVVYWVEEFLSIPGLL